MVFSQYLNNHRILKRLAKTLIRLRICAGWSEALLVVHATLLENSCTGSIYSVVHVCLQNITERQLWTTPLTSHIRRMLLKLLGESHMRFISYFVMLYVYCIIFLRWHAYIFHCTIQNIFENSSTRLVSVIKLFYNSKLFFQYFFSKHMGIFKI